MKRLVVLPSEPIEAYLKVGQTYEYLEDYYNPGGYFDEVYSLTIWGEDDEYQKGSMRYIKCPANKMYKKIKEIKPDVVRAYGGYISSDLAQISKNEGIPIIVSVHDTNPNLIYESLNYADYIICMAEVVQEAVLRKISFDTNKMWIMPNRIDENVMKRQFNEKITADLNARFPGEKHILHVGRKTEQKNIDTVIQSLTYLDSGVVAVFVGSGDKTQYERLAKELGVQDRCFFVESVKNNELPFWYSWCDCFCTPSRWEGFGFVFIEAAACEAPIVTSNIAPMNEYLTDGKDSILVDDYENPQKIADAINYVFEGGADISKMCKEARNVGLNFSKSKVDRQEISIYEEVMAKQVHSKRAPWIKRKIWERKCK